MRGPGQSILLALLAAAFPLVIGAITLEPFVAGAPARGAVTDIQSLPRDLWIPGRRQNQQKYLAIVEVPASERSYRIEYAKRPGFDPQTGDVVEILIGRDGLVAMPGGRFFALSVLYYMLAAAGFAAVVFLIHRRIATA